MNLNFMLKFMKKKLSSSMTGYETIHQRRFLIMAHFRNWESYSTKGTAMLILTLITSPLKIPPNYQSW